MSLAAAVVGGVLLVLGALALALLVLPLRLAMVAASDPARLRVTLRLLSRRGPEVVLIDTAVSAPQPDATATAPEFPRETPRNDSPAVGLRRGMRMLHATPRFLAEAGGQLRIDHCRGWCRFGLEDPADTGQLYGALVPATVLLRDRLTLSPVFDGACFDARLSCMVSLVPIRLLRPLIRFGWRSFGPAR